MSPVNLFLLLIAFALSSCKQLNKKLEYLEPVRAEIRLNLEEASSLMNNAIKDNHSGMNRVEIWNRYEYKLDSIRGNVDGLLLKAARIAEDVQLNPEVYNAWMNRLNFDSLHIKNSELIALGIDFASLPETHEAELTQTFTDSLWNISFQSPDSWTKIEKEEFSFCLIKSDPDASLPILFGYKINPRPGAVTTQLYYEGNLKTMKERYSGLAILKEKNIMINGEQGKITFFRINRAMNDELYGFQIHFIKDQKGVTILGSCTGKNTFEENKNTLIEMARTIHFTSRR